MLGTQNLLLFVAAGILLNVTPGQDTFYILGRSIAQGRRAGVISVLGITSGCSVHTYAAAFVLSAILATSANAFLLVKMAGAAYLTYLGLKMILHRASNTGLPGRFAREDDWSVYRGSCRTCSIRKSRCSSWRSFLSSCRHPRISRFWRSCFLVRSS